MRARVCTLRSMETRKKLAAWLARSRRSRASLAREMGIADYTIKRWLVGIATPSGPLALKLEEVTGIPATEWWA